MLKCKCEFIVLSWSTWQDASPVESLAPDSFLIRALLLARMREDIPSEIARIVQILEMAKNSKQTLKEKNECFYQKL